MWRGEVQDLLSQISQLQAENKRLQQSLPLKEPPILEEEPEKQEGGLVTAFPQKWSWTGGFFFYSFLYILLHVMMKQVIYLQVFLYVAKQRNDKLQ